MKKVLHITQRLEDKRRRALIETHKKRIETLKRVVQCASCQFKCAMCGYHLTGEGDARPPDTHSLNMPLCENCREEFEAFLEYKAGKRDPDAFWHTEAWARLWAAWFDYQQAIKGLRYSRDFEMLNEKT